MDIREITKRSKMLAGVIVTSLPVVLCLSVLSNQSIGIKENSSAAASHVCSGNHYSLRTATFSESGTLEYWVCCECHQHYYSKPNGSAWTEAGLAPIVGSDDDRYIPQLANTETPSEEEMTNVVVVPAHTDDNISDKPIVVDEHGEDTGLIIEETGNNSNEYNVIGYEGTSTTVIIPEGIVSIDTWGSHPFNGANNENVSNIEVLVVPDTVGALTVTAFENMPNLKTLVIAASNLNYGVIQNCPNLTSIYLTDNVKDIVSTAFISANTQDITIYCEATSKPNGWCPDWNISNYNTYPATRFNTVWGVKY